MRRRIRLRTTASPICLLHADAKAAPAPAVGAIKNDKLRRRAPAAAAINRFEFGAAHQTRRTGEIPAARRAERLDGRKAMAALLAARREDLAAPFGLHARAEAMRLVATAHFGLKGTFRQRKLLRWARSLRTAGGPKKQLVYSSEGMGSSKAGVWSCPKFELSRRCHSERSSQTHPQHPAKTARNLLFLCYFLTVRPYSETKLGHHRLRSRRAPEPGNRFQRGTSEKRFNRASFR